jgi:hypothetical protein
LKTPALALALLLLAACAARPPKLEPPERVDSFCPGPPPPGAAVTSIISSVADAIQPIDVPDEAALQRQIKDETGVVAHWKSQPLYMPGTARALGASGDYVEITDTVIPNVLSSSDARTLYVTIRLPSGNKRVALRAYDLQDLCVAGRMLG